MLHKMSSVKAKEYSCNGSLQGSKMYLSNSTSYSLFKCPTGHLVCSLPLIVASTNIRVQHILGEIFNIYLAEFT